MQQEIQLPFPDRTLADRELERDPCYGRIPPQDRAGIVESAWNKGANAARALYREQAGSCDFFSIARASGLKLVEKDVDFVSGNQRYFSDYIAGQSVVNLYLKSIGLWAQQNGMELKQAENLILSHEYFHFLEWTRLGLTSREYRVPMLCVGPLRLGNTGIRALSEIGAHAFARTYHELCKEADHGADIEL